MANKLSKLTITDKVSGDNYPVTALSNRRTKEDEMRERRWKAKDALQCLIRAEEIRRDKQLMADIQVVAAEEQKRLQSVRKRPGAK